MAGERSARPAAIDMGVTPEGRPHNPQGQARITGQGEHPFPVICQ